MIQKFLFYTCFTGIILLQFQALSQGQDDHGRAVTDIIENTESLESLTEKIRDSKTTTTIDLSKIYSDPLKGVFVGTRAEPRLSEIGLHQAGLDQGGQLFPLTVTQLHPDPLNRQRDETLAEFLARLQQDSNKQVGPIYDCCLAKKCCPKQDEP